jgi:hypothetical protein
MTRADLYDWLRAHGCTVEPLKELTTGMAIKVINPKTGSHYYLNLPIDEKPVKHFNACQACISLNIPIPDECAYMKQLHDHIKENHQNGR